MPRLIVIAILTLFGSACSRTELAYRNADSLLEFYAWKTVHISAAQREQWQPVLHTALRHHREQELPLVIDYLDLVARTVREPDGTAGAACLVDGALLLYQRHARLAVDLAAPLLAELDAVQVEHLAEYTAQRQLNSVKRYHDPDPQRRKAARQERITDRIERWTGKLNDSQRRHIKVALEQIPDLSASWLVIRAQRTEKLLAMLKTGTNTQALRAYLDDWWVHRGGTSTETRQHWRVARHEFVQLMDKLANTLTDRQRSTLETRLTDLRKDLASFVSRTPQPVELEQRRQNSPDDHPGESRHGRGGHTTTGSCRAVSNLQSGCGQFPLLCSSLLPGRQSAGFGQADTSSCLGQQSPVRIRVSSRKAGTRRNVLSGCVWVTPSYARRLT